jgi:hypothetical protein
MRAVDLNTSATILMGAPITMQAWVQLTARFKESRAKSSTAPGTWQARCDAYRRFEEAAMGVALNMQLVSELGAPPPYLGAMWTWPAVLRAMRGVIDGGLAMQCALIDVATVGDDAAFDAALPFGSCVIELIQAHKPTPGKTNKKKQKPQPEEFRRAVDAVNAALLAFVDAAREDLRRHDTTQ